MNGRQPANFIDLAVDAAGSKTQYYCIFNYSIVLLLKYHNSFMFLYIPYFSACSSICRMNMFEQVVQMYNFAQPVRISFSCF